MMRPKVFHGTYYITCANSVLPTFMLHPRLAKPESIANAQSEIQIVDTRFSFKTRISTGFAAGTPQLNRTPLRLGAS
jgi:hypothetical protein